MMRWFQKLLPREDAFFDLFEKHAQTLVAGADTLQKLLEGGDDVPRWCKEIVKHEAEADHIAHDVLVAVRRTFITPFDRSDIKDLIQSMDDAIDQMNKTAKAITLFEARSFDPPMREIAGLALDAARRTAVALPYLREIGRHAGAINSYTEEVVKLEERSDHLHDEGLRELYRRHKDGNAMAFIVGVEIYDHLEKVVDRFEDVANEINGIVIEHM
jgi:predicted phosphate transport protein (TIGR00153 family)